MKRRKTISFSIFLVFLGFLLCTSIASYGQAPLGINYQGIARNMDGSPRSEKVISIKVSILDGGITGIVEYAEVHQLLTNQFGLFSLVIGQGEHTGTINDVNWSEGNKWLQIEMDTDGGNDFEIIGAQQILSVPYAMYATQSGTGIEAGAGIEVEGNTITNSAPDREVTLLGAGDIMVSGDYPDYIISGTDEVEDADSDPTNEIQNLTQTGSEVVLSNSGGTISVEDADADPVNEIQDLSSTSNGTDRMISISDGAGTTINIADADNDPTNEMQTASEVEVTPSGDLSSDDVQSALVELQGEINSDPDTDASNEIQDLSSSENGTDRTINISSGTGTTFSIADQDNDPANEIQTAIDVGIVPSGNLSSVEVQSALEELQTDIDADGDTDAGNELQDAGEVAVTPSGNLTSSNVQNALEELQGDIDADGDTDPANEIQDLSDVLLQGNDAGGLVITNIADPVNDQDAVTKNYLDVKDATDYAFKVPLSVTSSINGDLVFDLTTFVFDDGGLISGSQLIILEDGFYAFVVKGNSSLATPADVSIVINSVDNIVFRIPAQSLYRDTFLFQLNTFDVVELKAIGATSGEVFTLEFFGYKI